MKGSNVTYVDGTEAGYPIKDGRTFYTVIFYKNIPFKAHHVAWVIHTNTYPEGVIDHIDGDGLNNSKENLRLVSQSGNCINSRMKCNNTSGVTGVGLFKRDLKWAAQIWVDNKKINLGRFTTILEAAVIRRNAEIKYGFDVYKDKSSAQQFINDCLS